MADLYDDLTMPPELRKAHKANDKAVMETYSSASDISEDIVTEPFKLYEKKVEETELKAKADAKARKKGKFPMVTDVEKYF